MDVNLLYSIERPGGMGCAPIENIRTRYRFILDGYRDCMEWHIRGMGGFMATGSRTERDSMGSLEVPVDALYGAQTQRAINHFDLSPVLMPASFIRAVGLIKCACARANGDLGSLDGKRSDAISQAALEVSQGAHHQHFPVSVFQTGSGTSTNMNANEVIATLASRISGSDVHPNDDVNRSQSSNDVIPTAIKVSACLDLDRILLPELKRLSLVLSARAESLSKVVKTGRTHLMDALPLTLGQEISAWQSQIDLNRSRIREALMRMAELPLGGTAIGTGLNAPAGFGASAVKHLCELTGFAFRPLGNLFEGIASQDSAVEMSGHLNTAAVSLMKISNDLRWMNSGPLAGLGEIELQPLQPGSSIMPGKINPVIPEAVAMACAQVMGNHVTITIAGQSGHFQLNVMLPVIAHNLLDSIGLIAGSARQLTDVVAHFTVNADRLQETLYRNPILVTALNSEIGYEKGAKIAKRAYEEGRDILDVAQEETGLDRQRLARLIDPLALTGALQAQAKDSGD